MEMGQFLNFYFFLKILVKFIILGWFLNKMGYVHDSKEDYAQNFHFSILLDISSSNIEFYVKFMMDSDEYRNKIFDGVITKENKKTFEVIHTSENLMICILIPKDEIKKGENNHGKENKSW